MAESAELVAKLQASDLEVQGYVSALKAKLAKSQTRVVNLEAENVSLEFRIEAIKKGRPDPQAAQMSKIDIANRLIHAADLLGYDLVKRKDS